MSRSEIFNVGWVWVVSISSMLDSNATEQREPYSFKLTATALQLQPEDSFILTASSRQLYSDSFILTAFF